jgi:transposase InsO family protein
MDFHANHRLGLPQRHALCLAIERGTTLKAAAAAFNVAPATAHRWWHRWREAEGEERRSLHCLRDRSSCPHRQPRRLSALEEEPILRARLETNLGPGRPAGIVRRARSTIWKVLWRHGLSRRPRQPAPPTRRYEWSRPGALLHVDTAQLAAFRRPGHRVRAPVYRSLAFQMVLRRAGAKHIPTPPYTPRWNGKVERFIQTLKREWAYAHTWPNSAARSRALDSYLRTYNRRRPHSSLRDRPPISRVHNVRGQDS